MERIEQHPVVTRGRIVLLGLLAALFWVVLSVFASSSPAAADDRESGGSLLDTITATVDEISPVPAVTEPVTAVIDEVVEPLEPAVQQVAQQPTVEPVVRTAKATLKTTAETVNEVVEPVLEQPLIAETVQLLDSVADEAKQALESGTESAENVDNPAMISAEAAPAAFAANGPEPVAVGITAEASESMAPHVPATGSLSLPENPVTPAAPLTTPGSALNQSSGAPTLLAAVTPLGVFGTVTGASVALTDFALPSSPTFDTDTSPG